MQQGRFGCCDVEAGCEALSLLEPITAFSLNDSMFQLALEVGGWDRGRFAFSHKLQDASRNHGRVDAMRDLQAGSFVAVKKMPNWWVRSGPDEFWQKRPYEQEQPWCDFGILRELNKRQFPYSCNFLGLFADSQCTYAITSLASSGDMNTWAGRLPRNPQGVERRVLPVAAQLCEAVQMLHELGVAHRDLSLENVLIADVDGASPDASPVQVKLIDFGMAVIGRMQGSSTGKATAGKRSYCAPELHRPGIVDAFAADAFSVGVILYAAILSAYPWKNTKPNTSASLEHAKRVGMWAHLSTRCQGDKAISCMVSQECLKVMAGLMELDPAQRLCLGESCMLQEGRQSALASAWLQAASPGGTSDLAESAWSHLTKEHDCAESDMSTVLIPSPRRASESGSSSEMLSTPRMLGGAACHPVL